ncbi:hypothetical protein G7Z17_g12770 [Cylindrodendrum hubeiense]|uniref:Beta-xylosidase C-terminal Concanavalin A-like domain-containing protein n=1 Tax=Cylindrodendrum hubeiense TaxID=595255 RepID=A0A9P5LA96_9HYPO|nr:hypothetical protein G7Z17_g12770 [Cylindrodendrum hubeiense]
MLLRKQTSYNQTFSAKMEFNPTQRGYEAGVVLWWSNYSYATIGVVGAPDESDSKREVVVRSPGGTSQIVPAMTFPVPLTVERVEFKIHATPTSYELSISANDKAMPLTVLAKDLTVAPPVGGAFTGVMFGVYSFGRGEPVLDPADFTDIVTKEHES